MTKRIRFSPFVTAGVFAGLAALGAASRAEARDVPMVVQPPIDAGVSVALGASTADVDNDGDQDALAAMYVGDQVLWYENTAGNGSAWTPHLVAVLDGASFVHGTDVDGDGDVDLLVTAFTGSSVHWYENTAGNGSAWVDHLIANTGVSAAETVWGTDVDGDGDVDAMVAARSSNLDGWFENVAGNGTVWTLHTIGLPSGAESVFPADIDRDGDVDAVGTSFNGGSVTWFENAGGNGGTWLPHLIANNVGAADFVVAADVDRDGDLDVLVASYGGQKVAWYRNADGHGTAWTPGTIATGIPRMEAVMAGDVDGDGDVDALSASGSPSKIAWYENVNGDGSVWTTRTITTAATRAYSVWPADIDGDGDLDVLGGANQVQWYRNETIHASACFAAPPPISTAANGAVGAFALDLDRDGDQDAVSASLLDGKVAWYDNTAGNGTAWTTRTVTTAAPGAYSVVGADVDGDGDPDLLSANGSNDTIAWYDNTGGNASAWTLRTITTGADSATAVFAADLDGDGDADALSTSFNDDKVAWYENAAGNGGVWVTHTISTAANGAHSVFAADVDGDGDQDALSSSFYDSKVAWYENTAGNGSAWVTHTISTAATGTVSVFATDLDRDGDVDVLATWNGADTVAWYENTAGNGSVWTTHLVTTTADGAESVSAADLDGDGDVDVLSASYGDGKVAWYENTAGNGTTWVLHTLSISSPCASEVLATDLDGDGDADVVATSSGNDAVNWYDDRRGQFSLTVTDTAPGTAGNGELAAMLRIDAAHLGRAGDHDAELASLGLLLEESAGDPLTTAEANALIASLRIYRDANGDGVFDPGDTLVATVADLVLTAGVQTVAFADGDANVQLTLGAPRTYFVVVELAADANQQTPHQLRVTHLGLGPSASVAEDRDFDIRLLPACPADVSSSIKQAVPVELMGFGVE
jgi:FG-GAP-like repeat